MQTAIKSKIICKKITLKKEFYRRGNNHMFAMKTSLLLPIISSEIRSQNRGILSNKSVHTNKSLSLQLLHSWQMS